MASSTVDVDVIVIGAGYGGVTAAALLAHRGKRVVLVDKTPRAGGKTQTLDRLGYRYEMFGAVGIPAIDSRFHELVEVLGIEDRVEFLIPEGEQAAVHYRPPEGGWRTLRSALRQTGSEEELAGLARVFGATEEEIPLTDGHLRSSWGDRLYRILLHARNPGSAGEWTLRIAQA
jgi:phytoene dehydrogenase-like protein